MKKMINNSIEVDYVLLKEEGKKEKFRQTIVAIESVMAKVYSRLTKYLSDDEDTAPEPIRNIINNFNMFYKNYIVDRMLMTSYLLTSPEYDSLQVTNDDLHHFFSSVKTTIHELPDSYGCLVFFDNESDIFINALTIRDIMTVSEMMSRDNISTDDLTNINTTFGALAKIVSAYDSAESSPYAEFANFYTFKDN